MDKEKMRDCLARFQEDFGSWAASVGMELECLVESKRRREMLNSVSRLVIAIEESLGFDQEV